jgi:hypothetical protein
MKKSHKQQVLEILQDYQPHSTFEIVERMFGTSDTQRIGLFRCGARIADLKIDGHKIKSWKDSQDPRKHWYQLERPTLPYTEERYEKLLKRYWTNCMSIKKTDEDPKYLLDRLAKAREKDDKRDLQIRIYYKLADMFGNEPLG